MYTHVKNNAFQNELEFGKKNKGSTTANTHPLAQLQQMIGNQEVAKQSNTTTAAQRKTSETGETHSEKENRTGMPTPLKTGLEKLSGLDLSDVKVHYNSDKPGQLQALAYAQGTDIHIAPGQEAHLPHEAWHVVQQKQGRVKPTFMNGAVAINDDVALEKEADQMGAKALQMKTNPVVQRRPTDVYAKNITGTYVDETGETQTFSYNEELYIKTTKSHPPKYVRYDLDVIKLLKKNNTIPSNAPDDQITITFDQFGRRA